MTKPFKVFLLVLLPVALLWPLLGDEPELHALSNPLTTGSNIAMRAPSNGSFIQIPAAGANCAVLIQMEFENDAGHPGVPICSGYNPTTPLVPITKWNCVMPVCNNPNRCVASWVVRDTKPGVIWAGAMDTTDGGVPFRVERGAGCTGP